ncbi:hypothetical protein Q1695_007787 [Nippostrongylus brasiliensis]|nr:hypothetical protein Q1695_007787 [Nippostrongylus brasiliensis]
MLAVVASVIMSLLLSVDCRITDTNCTLNDRYTYRAVNCENRYSESNCMFMYMTAVREGDSADRNPRCYQNPQTRKLDDQLVQMAVNSCPKTCGYCCKTPEFSCSNKEKPRINCNKVTRDQCRSELWRPILIQDCPNVCGLCLAQDCVDLAPDCHVHPDICQHSELTAFVKANCMKTCGLCKATTTATLPPAISAILKNSTISGRLTTTAKPTTATIPPAMIQAVISALLKNFTSTGLLTTTKPTTATIPPAINALLKNLTSSGPPTTAKPTTRK